MTILGSFFALLSLLLFGCRFDGGGVAPLSPRRDTSNDVDVLLDATADVRGDLSLDGDVDLSLDENVDLAHDENVNVSPDGPSCAWAYRRKLTFIASSSTEDLLNFPVLVTLEKPRFDYQKAASDGSDLRFVDADGATILPYEIERWDPSGTSYIWVKVPKIDATSNNDFIWMYYGQATPVLPSPPPGMNAAAVWRPDFLGVWHLRDDPSGSAPQAKDSSLPTIGLTTQTPMASASRVDGKVGWGLALNGTSEFLLGTVPNSVTMPISYTLEAWINLKSSGSHEEHILEFQDTQFFVEDNGKLECGTGNEYDENGATVLKTSRWYYVTLVQESSSWTIYIDGKKEVAGADVMAPGRKIFLGRVYSTAPATFLEGVIDEARISTVARSKVWIEAQYRSMSDSLLDYGKEVTTRVGACPP